LVPEPDFLPYVAFRASDDELTRFFELTGLSYMLAQQLLFAVPDAGGAPLTPGQKLSELSYGEHDVEVKDTSLACEWITLEEYAARSGGSFEELRERASALALGPPEVPGAEVLRFIWPPAYADRPRAELPEPGRKKFKVKVAITALADTPSYDLKDPGVFNEAQRMYWLHTPRVDSMLRQARGRTMSPAGARKLSSGYEVSLTL
jgi:hypothetical protein